MQEFEKKNSELRFWKLKKFLKNFWREAEIFVCKENLKFLIFLIFFVLISFRP